jgi:pimeloyl-ACP methyl ester carboxylesterase
MALINHVVAGSGTPAIVFVHGFGCAHGDWDAQVAHFSPRHRCVAVDLRGHGETPGTVAEATVERFGADVAELMGVLDLPPAVLVGHSMGCRVVVEAALQAPSRTAGVILVDGSQFAAAMGPALRELFASPSGFDTITGKWFPDMFTAKSDPAIVAAGLARAQRLPRALGESLMCDMQRYDVTRLTASLASLRVPVMAIQTTYSNEKRERQSMQVGQNTPYLDMLRAQVPGVRIEIVPDTGHFPQIDEPAQTNALIGDFLGKLQ